MAIDLNGARAVRLAERVKAATSAGTLSAARQAAIDLLLDTDVSRVPDVLRALDVAANDLRSQAPPPTFRTVAERALTLGVRGTRLPTGFPTLNKATRGGLLTGRLYALAGAPGAQKTATICELARHWLSIGAHVAILAADEEADGLLIRMGQALGLHRDDLEAGIPAAREHLAERVSPDYDRLLLVDADESEATIEDVSEVLERRAAGEPSVLIVDSLQTAQIRDTGRRHDSRRAEVDATVKLLKKTAKRGPLVLFTTEMSRGAYGSQDPAKQTSDLAASKESGAIEYAVALLLALKTDDETPGVSTATIAKNRLGEKLEFRLRLDFTRATVEEEGGSARRPETPAGRRAHSNQVLRQKIIQAVLREHPNIKSKNKIYERVGGSRNYVFDAVDELVAEGVLYRDDSQSYVVASEANLGGGTEESYRMNLEYHPRYDRVGSTPPPRRGEYLTAVDTSIGVPFDPPEEE